MKHTTYFKECNTEIQTVLANVDSILEMEKIAAA